MKCPEHDVELYGFEPQLGLFQLTSSKKKEGSVPPRTQHGGPIPLNPPLEFAENLTTPESM